MATNFPISNDTFAAPSSPTTITLGSAGDSTRTHGVSHQDMGDAINAIELNVPLLTHDHSGSGARATGKLIQANTHQSPDTDVATTSLHHTIGASGTQAAAGNHTHVYVPPVIPSVSARWTLYTGGANNVSNNSDTLLAYQSTDWDTDPAGHMWSVSTPTILTVKTAGKWRITIENNWGINNSGVRVGKVLLNGTTNSSAVLGYNILATTVSETQITVSKELRLAVNDVLRLYIFQNSGVTSTIVNTTGGSVSSMGNALIATWIQP